MKCGVSVTYCDPEQPLAGIFIAYSMGDGTTVPKSRVMISLRAILIATAIAVGLSSAPAAADPPRDANRAFQGVRQGRSMPLPQLERHVLPMMGGADYLGPEMNGNMYRFKFIQNGRVVWVDVDGQGRVIGRSKDH